MILTFNNTVYNLKSLKTTPSFRICLFKKGSLGGDPPNLFSACVLSTPSWKAFHRLGGGKGLSPGGLRLQMHRRNRQKSTSAEDLSQSKLIRMFSAEMDALSF